MSIKLPRLVDASGTERARLHPVRLQLHLRLSPLSTAEMELTEDDAPVAIRDFVELYDEHGSVGVFRVASIDHEAGVRRIISLEHGLCTLSDGLIPDLSVTEGVMALFSRLMNSQPEPYWQLGQVDASEDLTVVYRTEQTNLLTAILDLAALLPGDLYPVFDQRQSPWTLHLRALSDEDACEGRLTRNLSSLRISRDSSSLCTRVYPYGADHLTLQGATGSKYMQSEAANTWGVISRSFTSAAITTANALKAVAEKYLAQHSEPTVSVIAQAVDLHEATQEDADSFRLGRVCRLTLPGEDTVLRERIIALDKPDVFGAPGQVTVTLCNHIQDTADEIAAALRDVSTTQTIGGTEETVTTSNRSDSGPYSSHDHTFHLSNNMLLLSCIVTISPDYQVKINDVYVDGTRIYESDCAYRPVDVTSYLDRSSGGIAYGQHRVAVFTSGGGVDSTVTLHYIKTD